MLGTLARHVELVGCNTPVALNGLLGRPAAPARTTPTGGRSAPQGNPVGGPRGSPFPALARDASDRLYTYRPLITYIASIRCILGLRVCPGPMPGPRQRGDDRAHPPCGHPRGGRSGQQ